jgi:hypothetical protein
MNSKQKSAANICKPIPTEADYSGHKAAPKGLPSPQDNFATKETIRKTTEKVQPVKAKSLTPGLPVKDTAWETAGQGHKPSVRTFAGSTTSRGGKPARASK